MAHGQAPGTSSLFCDLESEIRVTRGHVNIGAAVTCRNRAARVN